MRNLVGSLGQLWGSCGAVAGKLWWSAVGQLLWSAVVGQLWWTAVVVSCGGLLWIFTPLLDWTRLNYFKCVLFLSSSKIPSG